MPVDAVAGDHHSDFGMRVPDLLQGRFEWPTPVHAAPKAAAAAPAEGRTKELEQNGPVLASTTLPQIVARETPSAVQVEQPESQHDQVSVETEPSAASPNETAEAKPVEPLPPPVINKNDPYEVRALAAGLHPGLSRSLLVRLTKADFKNAAHAIRTAIAKTPDDKVFVWPLGRSKKVTRFQVRFVPSISRDCRRYIVEVIKDRWVTTAQAMEKCGQEPLTQAANAQAKKSTR